MYKNLYMYILHKQQQNYFKTVWLNVNKKTKKIEFELLTIFISGAIIQLSNQKRNSKRKQTKIYMGL